MRIWASGVEGGYDEDVMSKFPEPVVGVELREVVLPKKRRETVNTLPANPRR